MMTLGNGCKICSVPLEMIPVAWPAVYPLLEQALQYNQETATAQDVYNQLERGLATLWIAEKDRVLLAAAVAEVTSYPRGNSLRIWLLAGESMHLWKEGIAALESFGRACNCKFIEVVTRRGMEKFIRDLGFETKFIWSVKKLDLETH